MVRQLSLAVFGNPGFAVLVIDEYQVDIRRNIEFMAAQLAHTENDQFLRSAAFFTDRFAMACHQFSVQRLLVMVQHEVGKA